MDKQMKDIFCRQIDTELERISKLPTLDNTSLNQLHMLTDTKKNILKIETLENQMMNGSSYAYRGNSYDYNRGDYFGNSNGNMGNSGAMRMMPMYGNSGTDTYSHLEAAMRDARNEQEREEIRQLMSRYHN